MNIKKILIANRSEISSRIIFTCKTLNIKTVAIFCKEDITLPFVYQADENYCLKKNGGTAYLEQEEIIQIALKLDANAIHPGYGFLSEKAEFAQKVINAGLIWIGPSPDKIKLMANKINARKIMQKSNIRTIPGKFVNYEIKEEIIKEIVNNIGYPVILKDPLGGGGKGIRKVYSQSELISSFKSVKAEGSRITKSDEILIEKFIEKGRHIEVQIAGDGENYIHLYERECSIQRRHQKIIEETPCNFIQKKTLNKIYNTAIKSAKAINYDNIGTVEFIVTEDETFYFLEMNTRLQVEHSITEETTGIDLVALQINLADNKKLYFEQNNIFKQKHSIECRIYSEDTEKNFMPSMGKIENLIIPNTPYTRIDHNLQENMEITPFFDSMLGKVTVWGKNRNLAIKNMLTVLEGLTINGIKTNISFLKSILKSEQFINGKINTQFAEQFKPKISKFSNNNRLNDNEIAAIFSIFIKKEKNKLVHKKGINNWGKRQWG